MMPDNSIISVAFQGEPGAFSFSAARKFFDSEVHTQPFESFKQVFEALSAGVVTYAVIPIENTLYGSIHENYDHILQYGFTIIGETTIRIQHQLITSPGVCFEDIRRVFSHPVALDQCRRFFGEFLHLVPAPFYDTAGSVKMIMREPLTDAAAIASETAAELYGGVVLKRNIEDNADNFTRFFLLTKQIPEMEQSHGSDFWKTSLVFATVNEPGALFKAMACFALRDINLTKIESRPIREKPWEYLFYVDVAGCIEDGRVRRAVLHLEEWTNFLKVLGSYRPTP
jgi:prephenate dehydratase